MQGLTSIAAQSGTIQVPAAVRGHSLASALVSPGRGDVVIPASEVGDVEIVMSSCRVPGAGFPYSELQPVGDEVVLLGYGTTDWGAATKVERYDDSFTFAFDRDATTLRFGAMANTRDGDNEFFGRNYFLRNRSYVVLSDSLIVAHRSYMPSTQFTDGISRDQFMALTLDPDTMTGEWSPAFIPLHDAGAFQQIGNDAYNSADSYYTMCRLDDTHFAMIGRTFRSVGSNPIVFVMEWTGGAFEVYGPWDLGAKTAEAGYAVGADAALIKCTDNRLLAIWSDRVESDSSDTWNQFTRRPLCAQFLSYDLSGHTATAGPLHRFESGLELGSSYHVFYYPDDDVVAITGLNYTPTDEIGGDSVDYIGEDWHLAARTLLLDDLNVYAGSVARIADAPVARAGYENYWYDAQVVAAGDRLVFVWSDVGDAGGDLVYTKARVGMSGAERGAIAVVGGGVLYSGGPTDYEMSRYGQNLVLPTGEGLGVVEHWTDDYSVSTLRFILVREQT